MNKNIGNLCEREALPVWDFLHLIYILPICSSEAIMFPSSLKLTPKIYNYNLPLTINSYIDQ